MDPSYRIVPAAPSKTASLQETASSLGVHDTLQYGPRTIAAEIKTGSPLKDRLQNWEETQDNLKLTIQRNVHGMHAPMRAQMERKIVATNPHFTPFARSNIHLDILMGRDETVELHDVLGGYETGLPLDMRTDMEKKLKLR